MKRIFLALCLCAFIAGCSPSSEAVQIAIEKTQTAMPTATFTPTQSPTATFTPTLTPTATSTQTPTKTPRPTATKTRKPTSTPLTGKWLNYTLNINDGSSKGIAIGVKADEPVTVGLTKATPELFLLCLDHQIVAYVDAHMLLYLNDFGEGLETGFSYQWDSELEFEVDFGDVVSGLEGVLIDNPDFLENILKADQLTFGFTPMIDPGITTTVFSLQGLSKAFPRVHDACK